MTMGIAILVMVAGFLSLAAYDYWEGWLKRKYQYYLMAFYGVATSTILTLVSLTLLPSPLALVVLAIDFVVMRVAWYHVELYWHGVVRFVFVMPFVLWKNLRAAARQRRTSVRQLLLSFIRTGLYVHKEVQNGATLIYRDAEGEREISL
jgi:hypothetical protein